MTSQTNGGLTPSRRTLVKGAAWSVPVVAMAAPAHAQTCSPLSCPCLTVVWGGDACKEPGNANKNNPKTFYLEVCITNTCTTGDVTVTLQRIVSNAGGYDLTVNETQVIPQGAERCFGVYQVQSTNSANFQNIYLLVGGQPYDVYPVQLPAPPNCGGEFPIPNVVGLTVEDAEIALTDDGFRLGTVTYTGNPGGTGLITVQSPAAGQLAQANTQVNVTVDGVAPSAASQPSSATEGSATEGGTTEGGTTEGGTTEGGTTEGGTTEGGTTEGGTTEGGTTEGGTAP